MAQALTASSASIHQLPTQQNRIENLITNMKDVEFHFALEGISGKGENFLNETINEVKMFKKSQTIDSTKTDWLDLHKTMKES